MIFAVGIPDNIIIDYELACECDCEAPNKKVRRLTFFKTVFNYRLTFLTM